MGTHEQGSTRDQLLANLEPWADRAGYRVVRYGNYDEIVSSEGVARRIVGQSALSILDDRGGLLLRADDIHFIYKYFWVWMGPEMRKRRGLHPELIVRYVTPPADWRVDALEDGLWLTHYGEHVATLGSSSDERTAVVLCHVFDASEIFLRASFLSERGSRLFSPVDYYTRPIPSGTFSHTQEECLGPRKWASMPLGIDAGGWAECCRCLWCGKYWRIPGNRPVPMTQEEFAESLPWEPPGSFGKPIDRGSAAGPRYGGAESDND